MCARRPEGNLLHHSLEAIQLYFRQGFLLAWCLLSSLDELVRESQDPTSLYCAPPRFV